MRAHAYSKILSEVPLRQPEDGHYRPKHVVVHYIVIKYTSCNTVVFDYIPFSKFSKLCTVTNVQFEVGKFVVLKHESIRCVVDRAS